MRFVRLALTVLIAPPLFLLAAVCAGAAVAAHFGRASLQWDILAHFAPVWLAGALAGALGGFFFRGYARALIVSMGGVGVAAAGLLMAPEYLRDTGPKAGPNAPDQLKVIQFNVWHLNEQRERSIDWLIAQDPDIVIMEESRPEIRRMIEERTPWHATCDECETVIYSRAPPIRQGSPRVPGAPGPLTRAIFEDARGRYTVIGVHYSWPTDPQAQQPQEMRLARVLGDTDRTRAIVAGDLNSAPWSFFRRRWDAEFGIVRRDRALFSWPATQYKRLRWLGIFPFLPIDHVYAGSDWATVKVERGPRLGSDHYPVVITLAPVARR
ncbi:endonuclease/exonuclease/phosphatase family protein [Phenylobacterium sp.]|uniref:endonuclease/exonuclease/phosphatase family protein n=1 Tax=Phenylobacterium sp. TaxID=1871053 RepID=UPI002C61A852|nr:endonuclease/exonuclease/phosphatase family protein [Phenylobacterium sp.]HVI33009.1 endonuclease/exonuclease/phosphatase family protein [Phenylobacterium sp.]